MNHDGLSEDRYLTRIGLKFHVDSDFTLRPLREVPENQSPASPSVKDEVEESPIKFEQKIQELFQAMGYVVSPTTSTGDHRIDLRCTKGGDLIVVQCKLWKGAIGEPIVRDFFGAMQHEGARLGYIVTTGKFTPAAQAWASGKPMHLVDGKALEMLRALHMS